MGKLLDFYSEVVGEEYDPDNQEDRIKIQKVIFLAEYKGLNLGGYLFVRKERGPYSLALRLDIIDEIAAAPSPIKVNFSEYAKIVIERIKSLVYDLIPGATENENYELAASLLYLKKNDCRYMGKDEIIKALLKWKPDYDKPEFNLDAAWDKVKSWIL